MSINQQCLCDESTKMKHAHTSVSFQLKHWAGKAFVSQVLPAKVKPNLINDNAEPRGKPVYPQEVSAHSVSPSDLISCTCWFKNELSEKTKYDVHTVCTVFHFNWLHSFFSLAICRASCLAKIWKLLRLWAHHILLFNPRLIRLLQNFPKDRTEDRCWKGF